MILFSKMILKFFNHDLIYSHYWMVIEFFLLLLGVGACAINLGEKKNSLASEEFSEEDG